MKLKLRKANIEIFTRPVMTPVQQTQVYACVYNMFRTTVDEWNMTTLEIKEHIETAVRHYAPSTELVEIEVIYNE